MRTLYAGDIVLKLLGLLLLTAAALEGHELLTIPVAGKNLWSWRPFLIFQVEFELALGIWLLSGLFKRLAWLAGLLCCGLFCCVTLYKGLTGAASCDCFGMVHVNPWITLIAIDLPVVVALSVFRPIDPLAPILPVLRRQESRSGTGSLLKPSLVLPRFFITIVVIGALLSTTASIPVLNEPAVVTSAYEVVEPKTWVGKELPILKYIDTGEQLRTRNCPLLFYHHDCLHCQEAIPQCEQVGRYCTENGQSLNVALIEAAPTAHGRWARILSVLWAGWPRQGNGSQSPRLQRCLSTGTSRSPGRVKYPVLALHGTSSPEGLQETRNLAWASVPAHTSH